MKTSSLINAIKESLDLSRQGFSSAYYIVENTEGEEIKIRIADHQGLRSNNRGERTISFITNTIDRGCCFSDNITEEYEVAEDYYTTDTYQTIEEVLEWADIDIYTKDYMKVR